MLLSYQPHLRNDANVTNVFVFYFLLVYFIKFFVKRRQTNSRTSSEQRVAKRSDNKHKKWEIKWNWDIAPIRLKMSINKSNRLKSTTQSFCFCLFFFVSSFGKLGITTQIISYIDYIDSILVWNNPLFTATIFDLPHAISSTNLWWTILVHAIRLWFCLIVCDILYLN